LAESQILAEYLVLIKCSVSASDLVSTNHSVVVWFYRFSQNSATVCRIFGQNIWPKFSWNHL